DNRSKLLRINHNKEQDNNCPYDDHSERSQTPIEPYYYNNKINTCLYQNQKPIQAVLRKIAAAFQEATAGVTTAVCPPGRETNLISVEIFKERQSS
ncbi:1158_t:CDS:1, partial [Cetraspora pellucida]